MSLYRKHRPQKFADLIGQEHIVQTITNALQNGNFSHAYIFAGPKGLGKTTLARLLAKALNCQGRVLGKDSFEPCNKCVSCKEITTGSNLDMIEIDAASNRGIDEIRELRDKIRFAPTASKYKVYIIDECHMLTKEAFNALLKTLEEPPAHAIFILATTEIHKVPATILSRAQSFEFKKATPENILKLLKKTAKEEKINIDDDSLKLISRLSYGAFRDSLSMLDQVSGLGKDGESIELSQVQAVLGQTTQDEVWDFIEGLSFKDRQKTLQMVEKIYYEGKDLENFIGETVALFRKALLIKEGLPMDYELSKEEEKRLSDATLSLDVADLVNIIEKLTSIVSRVKTSILGQLPLEMAVFELTNNEKVTSNSSRAESENTKNKEMSSRAESRDLSDNIVEMKVTVPKSNPIIQKDPPKEKDEPIPEPEENAVSDSSVIASGESFDPALWPEVIKVVKAFNNATAAVLKSTVFHKTTDGQIILAAKFKFHAEQICNKKNLTVIEQAVTKVTGKTYKVDCIVDKDLKVEKPLEAEEAVLQDASEVFEIES